MNTTPESTNTNPERRSRKPMIAGVAAGLVAGGAIGLAAMVPSITNAAVDDSAVLQDAPAVDAPAAPDGDSADKPEPGTQLREVLQPLVDAGTINSAQADAVTEHLVENRPERDGRRQGHGKVGRARHASVVADLIGIDAETLRDGLRSGQSIADVAEINGVDVQVVIDGMIADAENHMEMAIAHGADEEAAAERLEQVIEKIQEGVYETRSTDG